MARQMGGLQGGMNAFPDAQGFIHIGRQFGIERQCDRDDRTKISQQVGLVTKDRFAGAFQVVIDPAARQQAEDVAVPTLNTFVIGINRRGWQQVGLFFQRGQDVRAAVQRDLNTSTRWTGHEQTGQDLFHFVVGTGLRQRLDTKADGVFLALPKASLIQCEETCVILPGEIGKNSAQARHP